MNNCNSPYGYNLVALASTISCIIANDLSTNDINILGDFFSAIGSNLSTIADAQASCQENTDTSII